MTIDSQSMITEHSVPSFSVCFIFFSPVFPIAFHLLPQGLPLGNTLKITIGPFVPTLGFSESVGWWVSPHCQIFCPVEMASQTKPAKYPRWQDQRWPRPVPLASRTFGRFSVCLTDCLSYIGLTFLSLIVFTSLPCSFSSHHTSSQLPARHSISFVQLIPCPYPGPCYHHCCQPTITYVIHVCFSFCMPVLSI